jgi:ankyrin repeat protein
MPFDSPRLDTRPQQLASELQRAILNHDAHGIVMAIERGADVNMMCEGLTPAGVAAAIGSPDILQLLIHNGASLTLKDAFGRTPLKNALDNQRYAVVLMLRKKVRALA